MAIARANSFWVPARPNCFFIGRSKAGNSDMCCHVVMRWLDGFMSGSKQVAAAGGFEGGNDQGSGYNGSNTDADDFNDNLYDNNDDNNDINNNYNNKYNRSAVFHVM